MSQNKIIIFLAQLIVINIFIIINILLNQPKTNDTFFNKNVIVNNPKITFGDILARVIETPQVLGIQEATIPTPHPTTKPLSKNKYKIAVYGDSMEETMGPSLDYLQKSLKERYPNTQFEMYNYGIGSEKVSEGLNRINSPFTKDSRNYPALSQLKPDILIIGSYAYNPFDNHNPQDHYNKLAELVNQSRNITPKTYILAEIAPTAQKFGSGPGGVNWPENIAKEHVLKILDQMQNSLNVSKNLSVPIINVFELSKIEGSNYGKLQYINTHDHIHPSILGHIFTAEVITKNIVFD